MPTFQTRTLRCLWHKHSKETNNKTKTKERKHFLCAHGFIHTQSCMYAFDCCFRIIGFGFSVFLCVSFFFFFFFFILSFFFLYISLLFVEPSSSLPSPLRTHIIYYTYFVVFFSFCGITTKWKQQKKLNKNNNNKTSQIEIQEKKISFVRV